MRIRTIKPEFWTDKRVSGWNHFTRLLYIGLWSAADDHGRGCAEPERISAELFPYDLSRDPRETLARVAAGIETLTADRRISLYEVSGEVFYEVSSWRSHQRVDNAGKPRFPAPSEAEKENLARLAATRGDSRLGTGNREQGTGSGEARAPAGAEPPPPPPNQTHDANIPTLDEIHAYANTIGATRSTATKFWEYHEAQNLWRNRHDRPINWKQKLAIWRDDDRAGRTGQANGHNGGDWRRAIADSRNARMGMSVEDAIRSGREVAEIVKRRSAERRAAREAERAASGSSGDDRGG